MGPTNTALHALFVADQHLREAQETLDAATRGLRIQRRRVTGLEEQSAKAREASLHARSEADRLTLDLDARQEHIDKLREHQQNAQGSKEFQGYLTEINHQKEQRGLVEEQMLGVMQKVEDAAATLKDLEEQHAAEKAKLDDMEAGNADKTAHLEGEVEAAKPARDAAAQAVPAGAREAFERLSERYDGEAMAPLEMPDPRKMEYFCGSCYRELMVDVYNKLATRDVPVTCPSCDRLLFIPPSLTPEQAVPKKAKAARKKATGTKKSKKAAKPTGATLKPMITTASAESLREAEVAGHPTVTCTVRVDGKAAGEFEAISADDLEQRVRAKMQAQDVEADLAIVADNATGGEEPPAAAAV